MKKLLCLLLLVPMTVYAVPVDLGINFTIPTTRVDGAPLPASEVQEVVFYDSCDATPVEIVRTSPTGSASASVDWADGSTHALCFSTVDTLGQEGAMSPSYTVVFDIINAPGAGTIDSVTVSCTGVVCRVIVQ